MHEKQGCFWVRMFVLCFGFCLFSGSPAAAENAMIGDVNGDGRINLADVVTSLSVASGIDTEPPVHLAGDVNADGVIDVVEAVFDMQWLAGIRHPSEEWTGELLDSLNRPFGTVDFVLDLGLTGEVLARGDYSINYGGTVTGDFSDQPVTVNGNQISSVYFGSMILPPQFGGGEVDFVLSLNGTTDDGTGAGAWQVDFDHFLVPDMSGTWSGERVGGTGITR